MFLMEDSKSNIDEINIPCKTKNANFPFSFTAFSQSAHMQKDITCGKMKISCIGRLKT